MSPLIVLTVGVILVFTPLSVLATRYVWGLYQSDRTNVLARVMVTEMIAQAVAALLLAVPTLFFVAGAQVPWSGLLVLVAIDILLPAGVVVAAYLWWLDRKES